LQRFSRKRLAGQRTICDGCNDETGTLATQKQRKKVAAANSASVT
jgi:hypothetical protein